MSDPDLFWFESDSELIDTVDEFIRDELPKHAPQRMDGTPLDVPLTPADRITFLEAVRTETRRGLHLDTHDYVFRNGSTFLKTSSGACSAR
ncbi:MAG: hypothetical protein QOK29_833 [Rhodospirillaceae bacterium]|jgi:hypothetical protein|nr:hypothetical protein [Rhodospirillaceae bacterium]